VTVTAPSALVGTVATVTEIPKTSEENWDT
jgi:hypothetical protein